MANIDKGIVEILVIYIEQRIKHTFENILQDFAISKFVEIIMSNIGLVLTHCHRVSACLHLSLRVQVKLGQRRDKVCGFWTIYSKCNQVKTKDYFTSEVSTKYALTFKVTRVKIIQQFYSTKLFNKIITIVEKVSLKMGVLS